MLTGRGWAVVTTGVLLWVGARMVGAEDLHIVAVGITSLPPLALLAMRWNRTRLRATRRLSLRRVRAGSRVEVSLELQNLARAPTSLLLLEDRLPPALGRAARAVLDGLRGRTRQSVSYTLECGRRGRYSIGPLVVSVTDPFGLARQRISFPETHDLIVYPEVEDLRGAPVARPVGGSGQASARVLHRTGEEFYTMRPYVVGDDLRRIHWPSTARSGKLMIRQDETGKQASASIYLDTRGYVGSQASFERAISAAASVGSLFLRDGLNLRLATTDMAPRPVAADAFLEALALVAPSAERSSARALARLRERAAMGSSVAAVLPAPTEEELAELLAATRDHGHRLGIFLLEDPRDRRAQTARTALVRSGWEVILLAPGVRLRDVWIRRAARPIATVPSS